jgi:alpha-glucosidase
MSRSAKRGSPRRACLASLCGAAILLAAASARAQDERRVVSPDGQTEFLLFVSQPGSNGLPQLAYQVRRGGRLVVKTSFLGLNIQNQEPLLGESDALTSSRTGEEPGRYRWLVAEYMQNGTLGRRIDVEVRVWDAGAAFRYVIPRSTPLDEIVIENEVTEFDVAGGGLPAGSTLPAAAAEPGGGWVGISELPQPGFPAMSLTRTSDAVVRATLPRSPLNPRVAFEGRTPLVCPWRILTFAGSRDEALRPTPRW